MSDQQEIARIRALIEAKGWMITDAGSDWYDVDDEHDRFSQVEVFHVEAVRAPPAGVKAKKYSADSDEQEAWQFLLEDIAEGDEQ